MKHGASLQAGYLPIGLTYKRPGLSLSLTLSLFHSLSLSALLCLSCLRSLSDFTNDQGNAAALWHVVFDDNGEGDLEEHEVEEAALAAASKKHEPAGDTGVGRTALSVQGKEMMMGRLLQAIKFKPTDFSAVLDPRRSSQDQDKGSRARASEGSGSSNAVATKKRRKPRKKTGAVTSADAAALAYILYPSCQSHSALHVCRDSEVEAPTEAAGDTSLMLAKALTSKHQD